jgi:hypothetical protein
VKRREKSALFAGSAPQRSLNALNDLKNLSPSRVIVVFYPGVAPLRFQKGIFRDARAQKVCI